MSCNDPKRRIAVWTGIESRYVSSSAMLRSAPFPALIVAHPEQTATYCESRIASCVLTILHAQMAPLAGCVCAAVVFRRGCRLFYPRARLRHASSSWNVSPSGATLRHLGHDWPCYGTSGGATRPAAVAVFVSFTVAAGTGCRRPGVCDTIAR